MGNTCRARDGSVSRRWLPVNKHIHSGVITPNQIPLTTIVTYLQKSYRSRISNHWPTIGVITPNQIPLTTIVTYLQKSYRSRISNHWPTIRVITPNQIPLTTIVTYLQKSYRSRISNHWATIGVVTPNQIPLTTIVTYLQKQLQKQNFKPLGHYRCHYTKSNPIDDNSNISSRVTEAEFQTIGPLYLHAVWYLPFTNSPRKHTVTYHFSDLQEVYSGNRQIHTKCQLQYFHPPHISTSDKCRCVIIHQTTKATEYTG